MKDKVEFGKAEKELPNGNHVPDPNFPAIWTMHCAPYRVSDRMLISNPTLNNENTIVVAVRHHPNRDYNFIQLVIEEIFITSLTLFQTLH